MSGFKKMHKSMIEFFSFFDKIPNWLRWILLIPTHIVVFYVIEFMIRFAAFTTAALTFQWFVDLLVDALGLSAAIIITVIMAPKYRVVVGIAQSIIMFIVIGIGFSIFSVLEQLGATIGTVVALLYVIYGVKPYEDSLEVVQERVVLADYFDDLLFDDLPLTDEEIMDDE